MKRKIIIGLAGTAGSGKDTVASMINCIYKYGSSASYTKWLEFKNNIEASKNIYHFADNVKKCLSIMFNIDVNMFNDRKHKDEYFYVINERRFVDYDQANKYYFIIENTDLAYESLGYYIRHKPKCCIKLRTLMQYFATDICREYLDDNIWINSTLNEAVENSHLRDISIIADVRFANEAAALRHKQRGIVIKLTRNVAKLNHSSEYICFECDYEIENNGSLQQLFYKILEIIQKL